MMLQKDGTFEKRELLSIALACFLAALRGSVFWPFFVETSSLFSVAWLEIGLWGLVSVLVIRNLRRDDLWHAFVARWGKEKLLLAFLAFAFLSIFWSVSMHASIYRTSILLLSTLSGAYIGYRFGLRRLIEILFWVGAVVVILSFAFSVFVPGLSAPAGPPYYGSWKGIYWHRNHLGALGALFNLIFLLRACVNYRQKSNAYVLDALFYLLSLVLVYLARSAAGYILAIVLHASLISVVLWLRFSPKLKRAHYLILMGVALLAAFLIFSNLEFIFGLLDRKPNLTGRVPLWISLLQNVVRKSPWIGYGFGAMWTLASFRTGMQYDQGWNMQIVIGDNGFMDMLLHVGVIGLALFLAVWVRLWILSFKNGMRQRTLIDFFPLNFMVYTLFANISFSLFLETESFIWMTMVAVLFALQVERDTSVAHLSRWRDAARSGFTNSS